MHRDTGEVYRLPSGSGQPTNDAAISNSNGRGCKLVATWDGGKLESPMMFKDVVGKIDGNVNTTTGERYYRINKTANDSPTYSFSDVNPHTGKVKG